MPKDLEPLPIIRPSDPREQLYEDGKLKPLTAKEQPMPEKPKIELNIGIEETLDAVDFVVAVANAIALSAKDGFSLSDIQHFVSPAIKLPAFLSGAKNIPLELSDLTEAEINTIEEAIASSLDLDNSKAEAIVVKTLAILKQIHSIIEVLNGTES